MRLIDADALMERAKNLNAKERRFVQVILSVCQSVDAVPVVRCEDCEYFLEEGGVLEPWCDWHEARMIGRGGFCSEGKRKDGDGK